MTPEERAAEIEFPAIRGSVTLLGGWELDEDSVRAQAAAAIRAERDACCDRIIAAARRFPDHPQLAAVLVAVAEDIKEGREC